ncbi:MAG: hypothetical protein AABZ02_01870 [Bacteroidota bacterium]
MPKESSWSVRKVGAFFALLLFEAGAAKDGESWILWKSPISLRTLAEIEYTLARGSNPRGMTAVLAQSGV